jgi:Ca2+/Na+ antiporter
VTITDNRTGESIEVPISNGGVDATSWSKLMPGIWFYDPSFGATAAASSSITELDGEAGILRYRGYPIEQLAESSTYLEVAYLLINGELPDAQQYETWKHDITYHTFIHENVRKRFMEGFHHDAHPMGILVSTLAALSTFYPDAKEIFDPESRHKQIIRLIAKMPTIAAGAHRHSVGMPFVYPDNNLDFCSNFLSMMWKVAEPHFEPDPVLSHALEPTARQLGLSKTFSGLVLLGGVGSLGEVLSGYHFARRGKPSLVLAATVGSTIQLVLLVAPLLVFAGRLLGQPMDLAFTGFEVVAIVLATVITRELISDGQATWFEGFLLLGVYLILAIGFYHLPE